MMRFAEISDIHGNLHALEAVARDIQLHRVDTVFNLGDSLSGPLLPRQTAEFLMAADWLHVSGNHDRQILEPANSTECDRFAREELGADHAREEMAALAQSRGRAAWAVALRTGYVT